MEILFDPINFLLIVAAITVLLWLKSVLGQRTGFERSEKQIEILPPNPKPQTRQKQTAKIIEVDWNKDLDPLASTGLDELKKIQPDFDVRHFLNGAKTAHEIILVAFAQGDKNSLKPLLNKSVFDAFESAIDKIQKTEGTKSFKFIGIKAAKIKSIEIDKKIISVGVNFESEIVSGEEKAVTTQNEYWVFEKELSSEDPNWKLASTDDPKTVSSDNPL